MQPDFSGAAQAADMAAEAATPEAELRAVFNVLRHKEAIQYGIELAKFSRVSASPRLAERLPFMDEDGYEWGRHLARIPKALFFNLRKQPNFGEDGLHSEDGLREVQRKYPFTQVKTVSGRTTISLHVPRRPPARRARVHFGPGTLRLN